MDGELTVPVSAYIINILPTLTTLVMGALLCVLLFRYIMDPAHPDLTLVGLIKRMRQPYVPAAADRDYDAALVNRRVRRTLERNALSRHRQAKVLAYVFTAMALSRILIFLTAVGGAAISDWRAGGDMSLLNSVLSNFRAHWVRWDASHYIDIIDNWYIGGGEKEVLIVFLPLYPIVVRGLKFIFLGNTVLAATIFSNICLFIAGWLMYQIVYEQQGERAARRAVRYLMFCPLSVFFSVPYTESLFLMLTLLAVYLARRRMFSFAVLAGALSAATRSLGVLVAIPIYIEMLRHIFSLRLWPTDKQRQVRLIVGYTLMAALVALGFVGYMAINWQVTGNPLKFLVHQKQHWSQSFGSMTDTIRYTLENAFSYHTEFYRTGTWIPQAIVLPAAITLLAVTAHRSHPGDGAYSWMYMVVSMSATWLLSGPRYLAAMYSLYPMLTMITRRKWQDAAAMTISVALLIVITYMYAIVGNIL